MKLYQILILSFLLVNQFCLADEKIDDNLDDVETEAEIAASKKLKFTPPKTPKHNFLMYFTKPSDLDEYWVHSQAKKEGVEELVARYDGVWSVEVAATSAIENDYGLVLKSKARHAALSSKLTVPFDFKTSKIFVVQYEVKFQNGQDCGGAYIKLLSDTPELDLEKFHDKSLYTIMFGPDKCGNDNKLHFIFQHKNPVNGKYEEKHAKRPNSDIDRYFTDKKSHLYTLVLISDNTFEIYVDQTLINSGNLLKEFDPPVNPPKEVDDPQDKKPESWDDRAKIPDASAVKPIDWDETLPEYIEDEKAVKPEGWLEDEPLTIPDTKAEKPKDWDEEMDGEWEAPRVDNPKCKDAPGCGPWSPPKIKNPKYKGKWSAAMIDNPNYQGIWSPRKIPNPAYFEDNNPYTSLVNIGALGIELWSMSDDIVFDNFIITDSKQAADSFAADTWQIKKDAERRADPNAQSVVDAIREATSERPWLWIVISLVIALPLVLIIVYCCRSSDTSASEDYRRKMQEELAHKKDDDAGLDNPDDMLDEEGDDEENVIKGGQQGDVDDTMEQQDGGSSVMDGSEDQIEVGNYGDVARSSKLDLEDSEDSADYEVKKGSGSSESAGHSPTSDGKSTRKRRTRKD